jgi:peptidoglycan/xylan/chitin deacetylase (PgdA/CDA1 family)
MSSEFAQHLDILEPSYRDAWAFGPLAAKLSRHVARNVRTKPLVMRNTAPLVTFTFDDVPASACLAGAPMLEQLGGRATFYVAGQGCGSSSPGGPLATVEQIRELSGRGHEIGCHTYSHCAVSRMGSQALHQEIERNAGFLRGIAGGDKVRNFAYPYGDFSWRSKRLIQEQFGSCRTVMAGLNANILDLGILKSVALDDGSIDRATVDRLIGETVRRCGWLIFSSHQVEDSPSQYGVSPALLEYAVRAAREKGCELVTTAGALELAKGKQ